MISVLIPVFNSDIRHLVSALALQIEKYRSPAEIIVYDDGSEEKFKKINETTGTWRMVKYFSGTMNSGRVMARKMLAGHAVNDWLLFLDGDSGIKDDQYIEKYLNNTGNNSDIIDGGRIYAASPPPQCAFRLHWKYGTHRENKWRIEQNNAKGFQSNNFLIHKTIFNAIIFPEDLLQYGHEDTWMGMQLENMHCGITHINNPVIHQDVQTSEQFLFKSELALQNLYALSKKIDGKQLAAHVKLYRIYLQIKKLRLAGVIKFTYILLEREIIKNLLSCHPGLYLFDLYRLNYFIKMAR